MENENLIFNEPNLASSPKRPQFITVLCILTFIGCGLGIIFSIYGYFSAKASASMFDTMATNGGDASGMMVQFQESARKAVENALPNLVIGIVCSLLCLFGAIQMWNLKKQGFYIYAIGEIIPPISAFILGAGGIIGGSTAAFGLIIAIVWIVLYGVNLKHMH